MPKARRMSERAAVTKAPAITADPDIGTSDCGPDAVHARPGLVATVEFSPMTAPWWKPS